MSALFVHAEMDPRAVVDALATKGFDVARGEHVVRTVLDTFDGRLRAAGLRLEAVVVADQAPTLVLVTRGDGRPSGAMPVAVAPAFGRDLPPGPLAARVAAVARERALLAQLSVAAQRTRAVRRDRRDKAVVAVTVYRDPAVSPGVALAAVGVEVEEVTGHPGAAAAATEVVTALGLEPAGADLVEFAAARAGVDLGGRRDSPTVPLDAGQAASEACRHVLANLADTAAANVAGVVDDVDPEFLHDLRVAVRRSRSVLSQTRRIVPEHVLARHRPFLDRLAYDTGPVRDLDVYLVNWAGYVEPLGPDARARLTPVFREIERRRAHAHAELSAMLEGDPFRGDLRAWHRCLAEPWASTEGTVPIGPFIAERIVKTQRRLVRDGRAITPESPAERLHDLRKDAKRLRYLLECFGDLMSRKSRKAFVARLSALQDNLGAHQDAEVHAAELRAIATALHGAGVDAGVLVAVGQLVEEMERRRAAARTEFAERFRAYDSADKRRELDAIVEPLLGTR